MNKIGFSVVLIVIMIQLLNCRTEQSFIGRMAWIGKVLEKVWSQVVQPYVEPVHSPDQHSTTPSAVTEHGGLEGGEPMEERPPEGDLISKPVAEVDQNGLLVVEARNATMVDAFPVAGEQHAFLVADPFQVEWSALHDAGRQNELLEVVAAQCSAAADRSGCSVRVVPSAEALHQTGVLAVPVEVRPCQTDA